MSDKKNVYDFVTDRVLKALENGIVPWSKPWDAESGRGRNGVTGYVYRGINVWLTSPGMTGFSSPYW